ncbi:MAG TPA: tetratricopeptide repeat protein [Terriglobia bacterium]|nr:tetratricopeptide repeat protein [Terriglobia bacterium]
MVYMSGKYLPVIAVWGSLSFCVALAPCAQSNHGRQALDSQFNAAVSHFKDGKYQDAGRELENLEKRAPSNFDIHELLGLVYAAESRFEDAHAQFERAVQLNPASGPARANLAVNLSKLGKGDEAEIEFRKAIAIDPHNYDTNHDFGEYYVGAGKLEAALPYLEEAQKLNPSSYENGYDLALAYELTDQLETGRKLIQQLIEKTDTSELHNLLAGVDEKSGDYVTAANEYERAAHMDPTESNFFDWGCELLVHQTSDPAREVFWDGLQRYPNSSRLAIGLGLALYLNGSYDEAVKALMHATDLNPADGREYYFLSIAYDRSPGQADEVIARFRRNADLHPDNAQAAFYYGMSLWKGRRGDTSPAYLDQIENQLKRAVTLDPSSADAHLQLANLYSQRDKYAEAVPEYKQALGLSPGLPDAHFRLGQAYIHLGEKDLAQKEFDLHQKLYAQHLVEIDKQRSEIKQFVYSMKDPVGGQ